MTLSIPHEPLPASEVLSGAPHAGVHELGRFEDVELGVWEMTTGVATDIEVDEVFIVLSGRARIDFIESELSSIDVQAGSVVRLAEGMRTAWTVTETLRKIYLARA